MADGIVAEELALLAGVKEELARAGAGRAPSDANLVDDLERMREQLLEGGMDFYERAALGVRAASQSALLAQLRKARAGPQLDPQSPYFAHLRLCEDGRCRDLCLGKATRLDHGLRIVDWRHAPIAQLFYRYRQGEEYEERIGGRLREGKVQARRTVSIRGGALERIDAPEGVFLREAAGEWRMAAREAPRLHGGEGAALRVFEPGAGAARRLGSEPGGRAQRAEKRLPDIAALIDPAQFALITRERAGFVAIRGAAGSGKTTVALHRIAWLAYEEPQIASPQTLFVVFSPGLANYVSHVLPALGVAGVRVCTFRAWAAKQRQRLFPNLPNRQREDTPAAALRLKLHPAMLRALELQVARTPGPASGAQAMDDWQSALCDEALLREALQAEPPGASGGPGGPGNPGGPGGRLLAEAVAWQRARFEEVQAHLQGERGAHAELDPEDDALLLRAWQLRVGPIPGADGAPLRHRHIAVDEVQDFSAVEVRVLMDCLDERRSLTLAGDTAQHVMQHSGFTSWADFFRQLGVPGAEVETLQVSYRSSAQIAQFAEALLGDLREADAPLRSARNGPPVEIFRYAEHGACIAHLADALCALAAEEPLASVALLTPSPELSQLYHEGLARSEAPRLHRVQRQNFRFAPGIEITEIEQAKGLEFDYAILAGADGAHFPGSPGDRRRLHVGATRAVHQLWVTCAGEPSPVIEAAAAACRTTPPDKPGG